MESDQNTLDICDITSILPHRYPFLLVDKVLQRKRPNDLERGDWKGASLLAIKNVTINEPYFPGHFPNNPIMPGVMIIEAMAQAAALLVERPHPSKDKWDFALGGIKKARFYKPICPGDCMQIHVHILNAKRNNTVYFFEVKTLVDDIKKAEAYITAQMF